MVQHRAILTMADQ